MIDFLLTRGSISNIAEFSEINDLGNDWTLYCRQISYSLENQSDRLYIIGDCINPMDFILDQHTVEDLLERLKGNFYAILVQQDTVYISSSVFGMLPVYYTNDYSVFSSSVAMIRKNVGMNCNINKKWIVNQLLFNYQFGNESIYHEISLLPSFSYFKSWNGEHAIEKYYDIRKELMIDPLPKSKSLSSLSDQFMHIANSYIPDNNSVVSFTGGFDGRTLLSVGTHFDKKFTSFSYGKIENDDVYIPLKNSEKLNIPYVFLELGSAYVNNNYFDSAKNYIEKSDGQNGFIYAHVDYLTKSIKNEGGVLLSGICGSELFRATHSSGAVFSQALIDLFLLDNYEKFREKILNSESLSLLNGNHFEQEVQQVIDDAWKYKKALPDGMARNKKLYCFIFEETFRKLFGIWVKVQMDQIIVRTPYIDFTFFKDLVKTELSGVHSKFLTDNPLKRYKGQLIYAEVIRKTNKKLYWLKTGKGYAPIQVKIPIFRPSLIIPFVIKRLKRKITPANLDNLGIISGIHSNRTKIEQLLDFDPDFFLNVALKENLTQLDAHTKESKRDMLLNLLSIIQYLKTING